MENFYRFYRFFFKRASSSGAFSRALFSIFFSAMLPIAAHSSPTSLSYQGRILKSDGKPLEYNNVSFVFQITDPSGQCVVYQEQITGINMSNSGGVFDVPIGLGSIQYPSSGPSTVLDAFNNTQTFTCGTCSISGSSYVCSDSTSTYTATSADSRKLRVSFYDGVGWRAITPDNVIRTVPYAAYSLSAERLGDNVATDFLTKAGLPTCGANTYLTWNGSALSCASVSGASGGTVTSVATGTGLSGGPITASGTISLANTTVTAGTYGSATSVPSFTVDAQGRLTSASSTTVTPAWSSVTGKPTTLAGYGITDSISSTLNLGQVFVGNSSNLAEARTLKIADIYSTIGGLTFLNMTPACSAGRALVYISATDRMECADLSIGWAAVTSKPTTLAGYGITDSLSTSLNSGQTLVGNGSNIATAVTPSGDVSMTNAGVFTVTRLQNRTVASTAPSTNQVLKWDGSQWAPATDASNSGTVTSVATGTGLSGGPITSTGTISLADTSVTAGSYGSATATPTFTVDAQGRLTAASSTTVTPAWSSVTGKPTTLSGYGITDAVSTSLTSGQMLVGNGSNIATAVTMSGDATLSNTGALTLAASGASAGTYTKVTVDTKGRVTTGTTLAATDVPSLDWSKITTGKPTTLSGYGITDAVSGSGTSGYIPIYTGSLTMGNSIIYNNAGNIGIGTTGASAKLEVSGDVKATGFISTSDRRLKTNIQTVSGLETILKLRGVSYNWKSNGAPELGTIAQEVEAVLPALVVTDQKSGFKAVRYQGLIAPLIEATKELNNKCEMSKAQTDALAESVAEAQREIAVLKRKLASVEEENASMKLILQQFEERLKAVETKEQK